MNGLVFPDTHCHSFNDDIETLTSISLIEILLQIQNKRQFRGYKLLILFPFLNSEFRCEKQGKKSLP